MKRHRKVMTFVGTLCAGLVLASATASAAYTEAGTFAGSGLGPGGSGSGNGELSNPGQADVNSSTGKLYIADTGNNRVEVFAPVDGGAAYDSQAAISEPTGLAIDQASGDVYVATPTGISKLDSSLQSVAGWTDPGVTGALAVDPSNGDLLVADRNADLVRRFEADGTAAGSFAAERPLDLAANSTGEIFVVTSTGDLYGPCGASSAVERFSPSGTPEGTVGSLTTPGAIAVDPGDDSIVVAAHVNEYFCEAGSRPEVAFFDASGSLLEAFQLKGDTMYAMVPGLASASFADTSSRTYAVTRSPNNDSFGATKVVLFEVPPPPSAPQVLSAASIPTYTEAVLKATIKAGNDATQYRFEYGPTSSYGNSTPVRTISGGGGVAVQHSIIGLQPASTYHFRVVATNSIATAASADQAFTTLSRAEGPDSCPNAALRSQQGAGLLPDCRAYELVSPADKVGGSVGARPGNGAPQSIVSGVAPDGNSAAFWSYQGFGDAQSSVENSYRATRGADGWRSAAVVPALPDRPNLDVNKVLAIGATPDLATFFLFTGQGFDPADQRPSLGGAQSPRDVYAVTPGAWPTWISRPDGLTTDTAAAESAYVTATADGRHVYFQSREALVPAAAGQLSGNLYERVGGETRMIGVDDAGDPVSSCGSVLGTFNARPYGGQANSSYFAESPVVDGAVSNGGSRVYFGSPDPAARNLSSDPACLAPTQLYLRDGSQTIDVSRSQRTIPDPTPAPASFQGAAADGSVAYFLSNAALTNDAGLSTNEMLYAFDRSTEQLTLVTPQGNVMGVTAVSSDGSRVYFVEQVASGGFDLAVYSRADGQTRIVAHLDGVQPVGASEGEQYGLISGNGIYPNVRISADGEELLFQAASSLTGYDSHRTSQVYLYNDADQSLVCVSCNPSGVAPEGTGADLRVESDSVLVPSFPRSYNLAAGGSRIFFESTDALVPRDGNHAMDVYEWQTGKLSLISDGRDDRGSYFFGASADGRDVFFTTKAGLLPQDYDNGDIDIYDARVGGGFSIAGSNPGCAGEACQGGAEAIAPGLMPGTTAVNGQQNAQRKRVHQKKKKKKRKAAQHRRGSSHRVASHRKGVSK